MRVLIWVALLGASVAVNLWSCAAVARVAFAESLHPTPGTFEFWLAIRSDLILECPAPGAIGPPSYFSGCGDGPKPPSEAIDFTVAADDAPIAVERIQRFLKAKGLTAESEGAYREFKGRGREVEVSVRDAGQGRKQIILTEWMRD